MVVSALGTWAFNTRTLIFTRQRLHPKERLHLRASDGPKRPLAVDQVDDDLRNGAAHFVRQHFGVRQRHLLPDLERVVALAVDRHLEHDDLGVLAVAPEK